MGPHVPLLLLTLAADPAPAPEKRPPDAARTHYLLGPTAYTLRRGEHSISQQEILATTYELGVADHLTLMAGAAVPLWLVPSWMHLALGAKAGFDVGDVWHLAVVGGMMLQPMATSTSKIALGIALATVTVGTQDASVTLSAGDTWGFAGQRWAPVVGFSGLYRVLPGVALIADNFFLPTVNPVAISTSSLAMLNCAGVRLMMEGLAVDLGVLYWHPNRYPLPWASVTFTFGGE